VKLNHMICPNCWHDFFTDAAYGTCDACQCCFYASQSRTCQHVPLTAAPVTVSVTGLSNVHFVPPLNSSVSDSNFLFRTGEPNAYIIEGVRTT